MCVYYLGTTYVGMEYESSIIDTITTYYMHFHSIIITPPGVARRMLTHRQYPTYSDTIAYNDNIALLRL